MLKVLVPTPKQEEPPVSAPDIGDPGSGSWFPPGTTNHLVADQSGAVEVKVSYVPGCLNGLMSINSQSGCAAKNYYGDFMLRSDHILSLRYMSKPGAGSSLKSFKVDGSFGANVGYDVSVWLATDPRASYASVAAACKQTSATHPSIITGPGHCPIIPDTRYYLNIQNHSDCLLDDGRVDPACKFQVEDDWDFQ